MKMRERSVAMGVSGGENRAQLLENDAAQFAAKLAVGGIVDGEAHARGRSERIEPGKIAEDFRRFLVIGDPRVVDEMMRRQVVADGGAAGKTRADGHRWPEIGLETCGTQ